MFILLSFVIFTCSLCGVKGHDICYPPYGCFGDDPPYDEALMQLPQSPQTIKTTFALHTRLAPNTPWMLVDSDNNTINNSDFSSARKTTLIIHGYMEKDFGLDKTWLPFLIQALLKKEDVNLLVVNWQGGAHFPYQIADGNGRLVAAQADYLLAILNETKGMQYSDLYIIGFSLGAQIAGDVGRRVREKGYLVDRITALDAASPYHEFKPPEGRLDPSDASFVDVIHTDTKTIYIKGFGIEQRAGHVDFYINGGYEQPGCRSLRNGPIQFFTCSHYRSTAYFIESINTPCPFLGYECDSYTDFRKGRCISCPPEGCRTMGYHADRKRITAKKRLYLETTSLTPFCVYHYKITVYTGSGYFTDLSATVKLVLHGTKQSSNAISLNNDKLQDGSIEDFLVTTRFDLGDLTRIKVWHTGLIEIWLLQKIVIKDARTNKEYVGCYKRWMNSARNEVYLKSTNSTC